MTDHVTMIPDRCVNLSVKYVLSIAISDPKVAYLCRPTLLFSRLPPQTNYLIIVVYNY